jgi:hypothetical protein
MTEPELIDDPSPDFMYNAPDDAVPAAVVNEAEPLGSA